MVDSWRIRLSRKRRTEKHCDDMPAISTVECRQAGPSRDGEGAQHDVDGDSDDALNEGERHKHGTSDQWSDGENWGSCSALGQERLRDGLKSG
ncbi:hypothetical protein FHL15_006196 [Xylaria flabelliformis]|uniref:Uncharacterized protein n=1 Tax=Xylaria flabelliformis TaxID=2512241 RepID=A0A553HXW0_9PEZI|nr:hypothetical protein FHL15_006196 [Xylaria flabelliformis]